MVLFSTEVGTRGTEFKSWITPAWHCSRCEAHFLANLYDRKTVRGTQLSQHTMHMVFDGLFGKVQLICHLFVSEPRA